MDQQGTGVTYRTDGNNVIRHTPDRHPHTINRRPLTKATATALAAALNDAAADGAVHGVCDQFKEMATLWNGDTVPDHITYAYANHSNMAITATANGETWTVFDGAKVRPGYLLGDFLNEFQAAFKLGGQHGVPVTASSC